MEAEIKKIFKLVHVILGLNLFFLIVVFVAAAAVMLSVYKKNSDLLGLAPSTNDCNIRIVSLNGAIGTSDRPYGDGSKPDSVSTEILAQLSEAEEERGIKGVVLSIDSGGGSAEAGVEISEYLSRMSKPTVAWVRDDASSAAYWSSLGAKRIIAGENSSVGSIGVTFSYLDTTSKNQDDGAVFQQLSIGKFKDSGNPNKPLTEEEKKMFMSQASGIYDNFVSAVAKYRNIEEKKVRELADGSVYYGGEALRANLIDEIGGYYEVKTFLESRTGEEARFCWQ